MKKLAILSTHPIQYNAPLFKQIAYNKVIQIKVFYTWGQKVLEQKYDPGFGKVIDWDIPLLDGYEFSFAENISAEPGSHHFNGIDAPSIIKEIEDWGAEAILIFGWSFKSHLACLRYFHKKIPVLFRGDSTLLDKASPVKSTIKYFYLRWIYHFVDTALYAGKKNKEYFLKYGLKDQNLVFAPHAIDNKRFMNNSAVDTINADKWREQLGIKNSDIVFLFAGKLEPKKNPALLLKAFCAIKEKNAHLIIAGNGILENNLKKAAGNLDNIHFIPFQNQSKMPLLYRVGNVFVLPSSGPGETWGLAINEAMACGRAVLVSNKCGCAYDLIRNGTNGYIFGAGNENDLLKKMNLFLTDHTLIAKMGEASATIIRDWSIEHTARVIQQTVLIS